MLTLACVAERIMLHSSHTWHHVTVATTHMLWC